MAGFMKITVDGGEYSPKKNLKKSLKGPGSS